MEEPLLNLKAGTGLYKSLNNEADSDNDIIFYVNVMKSPST